MKLQMNNQPGIQEVRRIATDAESSLAQGDPRLGDFIIGDDGAMRPFAESEEVTLPDPPTLPVRNAIVRLKDLGKEEFSPVNPLSAKAFQNTINEHLAAARKQVQLEPLLAEQEDKEEEVPAIIDAGYSIVSGCNICPHIKTPADRVTKCCQAMTAFECPAMEWVKTACPEECTGVKCGADKPTCPLSCKAITPASAPMDCCRRLEQVGCEGRLHVGTFCYNECADVLCGGALEERVKELEEMNKADAVVSRTGKLMRENEME
jgi:hypothetical protein